MSDINLRVGGVPEHFNLPWHLACEGNQFQIAGANVSFREYGGGTGQLADALQRNQLDMAILLFEGAVRRILNGDAFRMVKLYTDSPLIWGIHVAADSDIRRIEDCRNKRFAISRHGSGSHLIAIVDAAERGWPTDSMEFVEVDNLAGARRSLANGNADVFLWERYMTKPLVDDGEFRRVGERIVPWPAFVIVARNPLLAAHETAIHEVLLQVSMTCQRLKQDPAAAQVLASRYDLLPQDAQRWLDRTEWNSDFRFPRESAEKIVEYLQMLELLNREPMPLNDLWHQLGD